MKLRVLARSTHTPQAAAGCSAEALTVGRSVTFCYAVAEAVTDKYVFVLMPFSAAYDDLYHVAIKPACATVGARCERVDEQIFQESILKHVYDQIRVADVVVAIMTERNPNVFYEVGYAHAVHKTVILATSDAADIPFDLKHYPHIVYAQSLRALRDELERHLAFWLEQLRPRHDDVLDVLAPEATAIAADGNWSLPSWMERIPRSEIAHWIGRLLLLPLSIPALANGMMLSNPWLVALGLPVLAVFVYSFRRTTNAHLALLAVHGVLLCCLLAGFYVAAFTEMMDVPGAWLAIAAVELALILTLWRSPKIRHYYGSVDSFWRTVRQMLRVGRRRTA